MCVCVCVCVCVRKKANPFQYTIFQVKVDDEKWDRILPLTRHSSDTGATILEQTVQGVHFKLIEDFFFNGPGQPAESSSERLCRGLCACVDVSARMWE